MRKSILAKNCLILVALAALMAGCKGGGPSSRIFVKNGQTQRMRIAVLPFDNVSKDPDAGRVLTNTIVTYLLSTGDFDVVEPGIVNSSLQSEGARLTEGITVETCQKLQPKLTADAYIIGMVEEYGEVRVGADTYPAISFSARLVDARTADILWAATISKTGADSVKLFDIGRIASLGKLSKQAVASMAVSLASSRQHIANDLESTTVLLAAAAKKDTQVALPAPGGETVTVLANTTAPAVPATTPAASAAPSGKSMDEAATYGERELTDLLKDVGTAKLGAVTYKKHFHDTIETRYTLGETGKFVELRFTDYRKAVSSEKLLEHYHPGETKSTFDSLPAFTKQSDFGYYHLDVAVGRFGIFLRGPKDRQTDIEALGRGIIGLLR